MSERASIIVNDNRKADPDAAGHRHALATIERAMRFNGSVTVEQVDVYLYDRGVYATTPEWLECAIVVRYKGGRNLTIGAIHFAK